MYSTTTKAACRLTLATAALLVAVSPALAQNASPPKDQSGKAGSAPAASNPAPASNNAGATPAPAGQEGSGAATPGSASGAGGAASSATPGSPGPAASGDDTSNVPVNLRLRQLEQRVQALKERTWRAKARVGMLKEAVLGGGVGATATILHKNDMGSSFRLIKLDYALDGTPIFTRSDDTGALHKDKEIEVLTGPIAPGSHTITVVALYRGHGYGVFKYLTKYKFKVRSSHTFTASDGKSTRIEAVGFERGGPTTPLEDRPAIDFKVTHSKGTLGN